MSIASIRRLLHLANPLPPIKMKIESQNIISAQVFSEICQPKRIFKIEELDSYLIYHTYNYYKPGTFFSRRTRMLSLYNESNADLKNHTEIKFPINDYAYESATNSLFLSTGSYDGGYSYEGELLKWGPQFK